MSYDYWLRKTFKDCLFLVDRGGGGGGGGERTVAQSVECSTPGEEVRGSIPAGAACSLLVGSVSV